MIKESGQGRGFYNSVSRPTAEHREHVDLMEHKEGSDESDSDEEEMTEKDALFALYTATGGTATVSSSKLSCRCPAYVEKSRGTRRHASTLRLDVLGLRGAYGRGARMGRDRLSERNMGRVATPMTLVPQGDPRVVPSTGSTQLGRGARTGNSSAFATTGFHPGTPHP